MTRNLFLCGAAVASVLTLSVFAQAQDFQSRRGPIGLYAKVDVETAINGFEGSATLPEDQLRNDFRGLVRQLLANPAVSGLTVGEHWDHIQPLQSTNPFDFFSGYDWTYLDTAFEVANEFHKPVQLIITPGVDAPPWLFDELPSCDGLFHGKSVPVDCGKVTFNGFPEEARADTNNIPLPWNPVYQKAWRDFQAHLNVRYARFPEFVAVMVSGPIMASTEMILPNNENTTSPQPNGYTPDDMWAALIANSFPNSTDDYQHSDQVFIDAWSQAISDAEEIFQGVTLIVSPDSGSDLPEFGHSVMPHPANTLYDTDCAASIAETDPNNALYKDLRSCEAKTEILSIFVTIAGPNGKATQVGGMTASSHETLAEGDIGVPGLKLLTSLPLRPPFGGGAEFDYPVSSANKDAEGCPGPVGCPDPTVEEAAYNVMADFFYGTPAGPHFGAEAGKALITYLEMSYLDIQYADAHPCPVEISSTIRHTSLQDLMNRANHDLWEMAGRETPLPWRTCLTVDAPFLR